MDTSFCFSLGTGTIVNFDEDTLNLIKYFKENIIKLQHRAQKFFNEGKQMIV